MARSTRADLESLLRADGFGSTLPSRFVSDHPTTDRLPIGLPDLDHRLGGGVPVGALTEVTGGLSSGRTDLIVSLLAETTGRHEVAAYVDATDSFDPAAAASRGVHLARLLWVRCRGRADRALKATDVIVRDGGMQLVVLDVGDVPFRSLRRIPATSFRRLQRAIAQTSSALLLLADHPLAGSSALISLHLAGRPTWVGHDPVSRLLRAQPPTLARLTGRGHWGQVG